MLRIRLRRVGARKHPSYRLVVADMRSPRDGSFVEIIGNYDPMTNPETITVKEERALHWLRQGAQPSETTARLLGKAGVLGKFKPVKEKP
jgi:small subunit ribosomal protein S16